MSIIHRVRVPLCLIVLLLNHSLAMATAPSFLKRCGRLLKAGNAMTAKALLDEAISQNSPSLWNLRAEACYCLGLYDEAILSLRQALLLMPNSLSARLRLGKVLAAAGDHQAARVQYEIVLAAHKDVGYARLSLARLYHSDGESKRAFKMLIPLMRGGRFKSLARLEGAIILAQHERYKNAKKLLSNVVLFGNDRAKASYTRGLIEEKLGNFVSAISFFEEAVEDCEDFPDAWNNLAINLERMGFSQRAEAAYRSGLSSSPENLRLCHNFAEFLIKEHRPDEAIRLLLSAADSLTPAMFATLGLAYGTKGDDEKAARLFAESLQGRPNHGPTLYNLAVSNFNLGRYEAAQSYMSSADEAGYDVSPLRAEYGARNREGIAGHGKKTRIARH